MSSFLLIILYIGIGYILQYIKLPISNIAYKLNKFVIYISLPAMILLTMPSLKFTAEAFIPVAIAWLVMVFSAILVLIVSRYLHFSKEVTGSLMLVSVLTNSSFVGIPIIGAYFGDASLPYILIYDQLGTFLALATYGTFIGVYYSSQGEVDLKFIVLKVMQFPPFIFLLMSFFLQDIEFNQTLVSVLELSAATIVPFALVAVGLQLQFQIPRNDLVPFSVSLIIKLIIAPIIAIVICKLFNWNGLVANVSILEAAMPPMITAAAVASMMNLAPRLSNAIVGYGILISFFTSYIVYEFIRFST